MTTAATQARPLDPDRRLFGWGVAITVAFHAILAVVLATATGAPDVDGIRFPIESRLCDGARCAEKPLWFDRRGPDEVPMGTDVGVVEASVVPMLGLAELKPGELPKLTKYEQAEKVEEAVNLDRDDPDRRPPPLMDVRPKKAEVDRKRKGGLASILGAPEDDDPRRRPTALERIVGQRDGSTYGSGTEWKEGNVYAGKVGVALRQQFTVPPFLSEAELRRLRVRIRVTRMTAAGQVTSFEVVERSGNPGFDTAATQAVQRFAPRDGGGAYLPAPDEKTLEYINRNGMLIDLDGALFRK
jgi:TonB family protein